MKSLMRLLKRLFCRKPTLREEFANIERGFNEYPVPQGGCKRIVGYKRFDGGVGKTTPSVPGTGPIVDLRIEDGTIFAVRGNGVCNVRYAYIDGEWVKQLGES